MGGEEDLAVPTMNADLAYHRRIWAGRDTLDRQGLCGSAVVRRIDLDEGEHFYMPAGLADQAASRKYWPVISSKTS